MQKIKLVIDLDRCWGCKACEVACKQELDLAPGPRPMLVAQIGPRPLNGKLTKDFVPVMCQHCDQPPCMPACPADAIFRESDGSIQIDPERCEQCGLCESACPYGVIEHTDGNGPVKCTLCFLRRENGWLPSCAQHCVGRAFTVIPEGDHDRFNGAKKFRWSTGRVVYVSDKWADLGKGLHTDSPL